jgi:hypothetical protein
MTYFRDLTEYVYDGRPVRHSPVINVGWLAAGHQFEVGEVSEAILESLWAHCCVAINRMRGYYFCDLCSLPELQICRRGNQRLALGAAEIRIFETTGAVYAAPNLIYHYVANHHYKPPQQFTSALLECPTPPSQEYFNRLVRDGISWEETFAPALDWNPQKELKQLYLKH